ASQRWGLLVWLGVPIGLLAASYVVAGEICLSANDDGECLEWAVNPIGISWLPNPEFGPLSTGRVHVPGPVRDPVDRLSGLQVCQRPPSAAAADQVVRIRRLHADRGHDRAGDDGRIDPSPGGGARRPVGSDR